MQSSEEARDRDGKIEVERTGTRVAKIFVKPKLILPS